MRLSSKVLMPLINPLVPQGNFKGLANHYFRGPDTLANCSRPS